MIDQLTPELFELALVGACALTLLAIVVAVALFAWRETRRHARQDAPLRVLPREAARDE